MAAAVFLAGPAAAHRDVRESVLGARSLSLGQAFTGVADDASASFWNPAGTAFLQDNAVQSTFGRPVLRDASGARRDVGAGSFSFVDVLSSVPGALGVFGSFLAEEGVRRESSGGLSYAGSWGVSGIADVALGAGVRYTSASDLSGAAVDRSAAGADLGLLLRPSPFVSFGVSGRDLNRPRLGPAGEEKLPARVSAGIALRDTRGGLLSLEGADIHDGEDAEFRWGAERALFQRAFAVRAGGGNNRLTAGVGLRSVRVRSAAVALDYAISYPLDLKKGDRLHAVSLQVMWGGSQASQAAASLRRAAVVEPGSGEADASGEPPKAKRFIAMRPKVDFPLGPADVLEINIKNHPELSASVTVDSWGYIKLPFIGEIKAEGLQKEDLARNLEDTYSSMMVNPQVDVVVKEHNSRVVYVVGQVQSPGKFPMNDKVMTLRDILVAAGLPTLRAATWRAFVVRQTETGPTYKHVNLYKLLYRGQLANNMILQPGDIVVVPMGFFDGIGLFIGKIFNPIVGVGRSVTTGL